MKGQRLWVVGIVTASGCLAAAGCSGSTTPAGGLIVAFSTDMSIPKDIDTLEVQITENGVTKFDNQYKIGPVPDQTVPATLLVTPSASDPGAPIQIRVVGLQNGTTPRMLRDSIVVVPTTSVAEIRMPIEWLCDGTATLAPADASNPSANPVYDTSCASGQTCVAGSCSDATAPASLPPYNPGDIFGGGTAAGGGTCFDTTNCFAGAMPATVEMTGCTIPAPTGASGANVAIVVSPADGDGICGAEGCLIPLDGNSAEGWQLNGGTIQLPPAVCTKLTSGKAAGVLASTTCATKTASSPTCGPWSSVGGAAVDAGGGPCGDAGVAGECTVTLASGQNEPTFIARDSTNVYWTDELGGTVLEVPLGGGTITTLASGRVTPFSIAVNAAGVYWTDEGAASGADASTATNGVLMMVPRTGGTPTTLVSGLSTDYGDIAADDTNVYFGTYASYDESDGGEVPGGIWKLPVGGNGGGGTAVSLAAANNPFTLTIDVNSVYWIDSNDDGGTVETFVAKVPIAGGVATTLTATTLEYSDEAAQMAVDATNVYWVNEGTSANNYTDGTVLKVPIAGGALSTLATGQNYPLGIAADGTNIYWTNLGFQETGDGGYTYTQGSVVGMPAAGGSPTTLAYGQYAVGIAVDATSVYWANYGAYFTVVDDAGASVAPNTGTIMKVTPKTPSGFGSGGGSGSSTGAPPYDAGTGVDMTDAQTKGGGSGGGDSPDATTPPTADSGK